MGETEENYLLATKNGGERTVTPCAQKRWRQKEEEEEKRVEIIHSEILWLFEQPTSRIEEEEEMLLLLLSSSSSLLYLPHFWKGGRRREKKKKRRRRRRKLSPLTHLRLDGRRNKTRPDWIE